MARVLSKGFSENATLEWIVEKDEEERAEWVQRLRGQVSKTLGVVIREVMGVREGAWQSPPWVELPLDAAGQQRGRPQYVIGVFVNGNGTCECAESKPFASLIQSLPC